MVALLSDFFDRWNQNIEINVRGLDKEYEGLYLGKLLEEEIERLREWDSEEPPHPDWISTRNFEDTGEVFGLVEQMSSVAIDANDSGSDADMNENAEVAADELLEIEDDDDNNENELMQSNFTAAAQWLAAVYQKDRPYARVKTNGEWDYFKANVMKFQGSSNEAEADNYSSIQFSAFAESWNAMVSKLGSKKPKFTYKLACHLKDAFKTHKKMAVEKTTLQPHRQNLRALDQSLRNNDEARSFIPEFAGPNTASRVVPAPPMTANATSTTLAAASTQTFESRLCYPPLTIIHHTTTLPNPTSTATERDKRRLSPKRKRKPKRCRNCGLEITNHLDNHKPPRVPVDDGQPRSIANLNIPYEDHCTIPSSLYADGYPLEEGQAHPRRSRKKARD